MDLVISPTTLLRPVHKWFFVWERLAPPVYRILAVAIAAGITALLLIAAGLAWPFAAGLSLAIWIALAVAQEHDERVELPPDALFVAALQAAVEGAPLDLRIDHATGPSRARRGTNDYFVLSGPISSDHVLSGRLVEIERSATLGFLRVDVFDDPAPDSFESLARKLRDLGSEDLAARLQRAETPAGDATAIASALIAAYS